ncbi:hypothetical protein NMY22_g12811 [Coprinellus aureogranulatus]|nr:hypothetical protein NMY22_g12811 [Coprinellus aureogranulatus]
MHSAPAHHRAHNDLYRAGGTYAATRHAPGGAQEERGGYTPIDPFKASLALGMQKVFGRPRDRTIDDVPVEASPGGPPNHQAVRVHTHAYPDYTPPDSTMPHFRGRPTGMSKRRDDHAFPASFPDSGPWYRTPSVHQPKRTPYEPYLDQEHAARRRSHGIPQATALEGIDIPSTPLSASDQPQYDQASEYSHSRSRTPPPHLSRPQGRPTNLGPKPMISRSRSVRARGRILIPRDRQRTYIYTTPITSLTVQRLVMPPNGILARKQAVMIGPDEADELPHRRRSRTASESGISDGALMRDRISSYNERPIAIGQHEAARGPRAQDNSLERDLPKDDEKGLLPGDAMEVIKRANLSAWADVEDGKLRALEDMVEMVDLWNAHLEPLKRFLALIRSDQDAQQCLPTSLEIAPPYSLLLGPRESAWVGVCIADDKCKLLQLTLGGGSEHSGERETRFPEILGVVNGHEGELTFSDVERHVDEDGWAGLEGGQDI